MESDRLDRLASRLRHAGVSRGYVQRLVRELKDHHSDLLNEEMRTGSDSAEAERLAWDRLGDEDALLANVMSRPELRSFSARRPALTYGLGAVGFWMAVVALTIGVQICTGDAGATERAHWGWNDRAMHALCFFTMRLLPALFGGSILVAAARCGQALRWPLIGSLVLATLAGTTTFSSWEGPAPGRGDSIIGFSVSQWLVPALFPFTDKLGPIDLAQIATGFARGFAMFAGAYGTYFLWSRTRGTPIRENRVST